MVKDQIRQKREPIIGNKNRPIPIKVKFRTDRMESLQGICAAEWTKHNKIMEEGYYLSLKPFGRREYVIHSGSCPFLPLAEIRIYLGRFLSPEEALTAALKRSGNVVLCRFCQAEPIKAPAYPEVNAFPSELKFISMHEVTEAWDNIAVFGKN